MPDCGGPHYGLGLCHRHWAKEYKRRKEAARLALGQICSRDGCGNAVEALGLCMPHYMVDYRTRKATEIDSDEEMRRFVTLVRVGDGDDCSEWLGPLAGNGYGKFWTGYRLIDPHRFAYEVFIGPIPEGLTVDHTCHNRSDPPCPGGPTCPHRRCTKAVHLEAVPIGVNIRRSPNYDPQQGARDKRAWAAKITRCPQDHPYNEENTYWWHGHRQCRTCRREANRRRRHH